jgi:hypothetical protein
VTHRPHCFRPALRTYTLAMRCPCWLMPFLLCATGSLVKLWRMMTTLGMMRMRTTVGLRGGGGGWSKQSAQEGAWGQGTVL